MKRLILNIIFAFAGLTATAHLGSEHFSDALEIWGEGEVPGGFQAIADMINRYTDTEAKNAFTKLFPEANQLNGWNHRLMGHQPLFDDIPENIIDKAYELAKKFNPDITRDIVKNELVAYHRAFSLKLLENVQKLTGLPEQQAKALATICHAFHLVGDLTPGNTVLDQVASLERIQFVIKKNLKILFKNRPEIAAEMIAILDQHWKLAMKLIESDPKQAAKIFMDGLKKLQFGKNFLKAWGGWITKHLGNVFFAKRNHAAKLAKLKDIEMREASQVKSRILDRLTPKSGVRMGSTPLKGLSEKGGVKIAKGLLQKQIVRGKEVVSLSVPVRSGLSTGVMTFIMVEGMTIYGYASGDITDDQFEKESLKNCGGALAVGMATYVSVALGVSPMGWTVVGIGVATEVVYEIAFEHLYKEFSTPVFSVDDVLGSLPADIQHRKTSFTMLDEGSSDKRCHDGLESLNGVKGTQAGLDGANPAGR